jgi:hypothetical protein
MRRNKLSRLPSRAAPAHIVAHRDRVGMVAPDAHLRRGVVSVHHATSRSGAVRAPRAPSNARLAAYDWMQATGGGLAAMVCRPFGDVPRKRRSSGFSTDVSISGGLVYRRRHG